MRGLWAFQKSAGKGRSPAQAILVVDVWWELAPLEEWMNVDVVHFWLSGLFRVSVLLILCRVLSARGSMLPNMAQLYGLLMVMTRSAVE